MPGAQSEVVMVKQFGLRPRRHWRSDDEVRHSQGAASDVRIIDPETGKVVSTIPRKAATDWKGIRKRKKERRKVEGEPKKGSVKGDIKIIGFDGPPCPRCEKPMQIREHVAITEKLLRQACYCTRWYYCMNHKCRTKSVYPDEYRVYTADQVIWGDTWDVPGCTAHGKVVATDMQGAGDRNV